MDVCYSGGRSLQVNKKKNKKRNNYNYSILQVGVRSTVGNCFDSFGGGGGYLLGKSVKGIGSLLEPPPV